MQAGETLNFIEPFDPSFERPAADHEKEEIETTFLAICTSAIMKYPENIKARQQLEESGFITAFESSLVITFGDKSYLHCLVYGHNDDEGPIDFGISIEEHDASGVPLGGYLYTLSKSGLMRVKVKEEAELDLDEEDFHFSLLETYESVDQLRTLEAYGDEYDRASAQRERARLEEGVSLELWEHELGYDGQLPSAAEIQQLAELFKHVKPRPNQRYE